ncbi:MAG TPA: HAD hydrolase-like protein [Halobacteria archaeon]|jgi:ribonucleotide monophosphatase NagD (HAD superfamily)|nr:HAD hydrolase-like protein [Halobacteria archaeon]
MGAWPFVDAIEFSTGKRATVTGKPSEEFFRHALMYLGVRADECAIIGDDLFSDVVVGKNLGIKGILVKTGNYRDDLLKKSDIKPDIVLNSISQLGEYI